MIESGPEKLVRRQRGAFLAGPFGRIVARPWLDPVMLWTLRRQIFPTSRLWAAAIAADGDSDRFVAGIGRAPARLPARSRLERAVQRVAATDRAFRRADRAWLDAYFDIAPSHAALCEIEREWRRTSQARFAARRFVAPLVRSIRPPAVRFAIPGPDEVTVGYDPLHPPHVAAPTFDVRIEESRRISTSLGIEYWLRAASPLPGDMLWAHVYEPANVQNPPTAILCHGLGIETEMLNGVVDSTLCLLRQGIRVVHPSAPGHNRRCMPGWYGGEQLLATQPLGAIETLQATAVEFAMLIRWARAKSHGAPVALGGTSLGALTTQFMADRSRDWPSECQPDSLLLATSSALPGVLSYDSSLALAVALPAALAAKGWTREALARLAPLTDPVSPAPLPPERIFLLLGSRDTVTPYDAGMALARLWTLPASNVFLANRGHFSAAVGLLFDTGPYDALAKCLAGRLNEPAPTL
ncbi:MAG: hypothetical protein WD711_07965 [Dongiaceae bacterium]